MNKELLEHANTLIDMDMRSGESGYISPEYLARSLQISIEDAEIVLKGMKVCLEIKKNK